MKNDKFLSVQEEAIIIDNLFASPKSPKDPSYFEKCLQAGVTALHVSIVIDDLPNFFDVIGYISSWYRGYEKYKDLIMPVNTTEDIITAKKKNKLGIILGFQSTKPIENNLDNLDIFAQLGIKIIQLTYQRRNWVGDGCGERYDSGLSRFGIEVVKRMNELGILIDLSHCGDRTIKDVIEISKKPVAFTHANARALCDNVRNKTDEQIKALVEKGGVISLTLFSVFVKTGGKALSEDFFEIVDHVVKLVGVDHVGFGFDYAPFATKEEEDKWISDNPEAAKGIDFNSRYPQGMESIDFCLPEIIKGLLNRSYAEEDIKKFLGINNLNLFKKVWKE